MPTLTRRERERAQREKLIITAARELAEAEGWQAVTTRRLAERIEYSQPVLYSHFTGMDAIMAAVAVEGFADLADEVRAARIAAPDTHRALAAVSAVYTAFADRHPAVYDAMFGQTVDLPFATPQAPPALHAGFDIPLSDRQQWAGVLQRCVDMDQQSYSIYLSGAREYGKRFSAEEAVQEHLAMFQAALASAR